MPLKIMLSAAEVSGDVHGATLARALKAIDADIALFGMGGERMAGVGVDIKLDITEKSTIGISEAVQHIPSHIHSLKFMTELMKNEKPDALIVIDAQGFHLPLAKEAKKLGIRTIYYIAPQEWLWGTERGVRRVAGNIDLIVAIFEKEFEAYKKAGARVIYEGHPLVDIARPAYGREDLRSASEMHFGAPFVGLFPGSRKQEITGLLPIMIDAVKLVESNYKKLNLVLALSSSKFSEDVEKIVKEKQADISIVEGGTHEALLSCDVSIAASGTILLEAAVLGAPIIMTYKLSRMTAFIARYIVRLDKRLPYYSMPNILANKPIIPEYVMDKATPENLAGELVSLLSDKEKRHKMKAEMRELSSSLGAPGVVPRIAGQILKFLKEKG